jgi:hypothetical protein
MYRRILLPALAIAAIVAISTANNAKAGLLGGRCEAVKSCAPAACEPACAPACEPVSCLPKRSHRERMVRSCRPKSCTPVAACEEVKVCEAPKACAPACEPTCAPKVRCHKERYRKVRSCRPKCATACEVPQACAPACGN